MRELTWTEFEYLICQLGMKLMSRVEGMKRVCGSGSEPVDGIWGVPRGGSVVAAALAPRLKLPIVNTPTPFTIIVDDVLDSGKTLAQWQGQLRGVLLIKSNAPEDDQNDPLTVSAGHAMDWVKFPYEANEAPAEDSVIRILEAIGENPNREGLADTPKRVVRSWGKIYGGYKQKPEEILKVTFSDGVGAYDQIVALTNIELYSTCEHHLLPFVGKAHIGYIPRQKVVGLSKLARLVEVFARRLQIQEKLTQEIGMAIQTHLDPIGVGVVLEAQHFCMMARGVEKQNSMMTTSYLWGAMREEAKDEFLKLCFK